MAFVQGEVEQVLQSHANVALVIVSNTPPCEI